MDRQQILDYLATVSNDQIGINVVMHVVVLLAIAAALLTRRAAVRRVVVGGTVLTLLVSVSTTALAYGNPFHLIVFSLLSIAAGIELFARRGGLDAPRWTANTVVSAVLIIAGLWYPEFVRANPSEMLLLSPVGRVPCPTLLVVLGLLGLVYSRVSRPLYAAVAAAGAVFGVVGTIGLGVYLDVALLLAAAHGAWNVYRLTRITPAAIRTGNDMPVAA